MLRKRTYHTIISSLAKRTVIFLWIIFLFSFSATALADIQLNPGEVQLDIGGILLDIESTSVIDNIDFGDNNFTVTMSAGQSFYISSADRKEFDVSFTDYVDRTCLSSKSTLSIAVPSSIIGSINYTITPKSTACSVAGGGAGAGAGVGVITPTVILVPTEVLVPTLVPEEIVPPAEIVPAEEVPPGEIIEVPPIEIIEIPAEEFPAAVVEAPPVSVETTVQAMQTIGSGIVSAAGSIGGGIVQIFRGATTGSGGSGFIARNTPNIGIFSWKTDQPLTDISGLMPIIPMERSNYKITVRSSTAAAVQDTSDKPFGLIQKKSENPLGANLYEAKPRKELMAQVGRLNNPSITIIAPNGGEIWTIGETYNIIWTWQNLPDPHQVDIMLSRGFDAIESIKKINAEVTKAVKELREDPVVTQTVKEVGVPISVTVTAASAGAITVTASASSATMALNITEFFQALSFARFYLFGLIRFRRRNPWGRIIDKFSGKPLRGATVQIWEAEYKKIKDTQLTDEEGRFGALVAPGKYYLKVSKKGFETKESDLIEITSPKQILNIEITLLPSEAEFSLSYIKKINFLNTLKRFVDFINPYLLAAGTIISFIILVIMPNALNYAVFFIYLGLDILKIYLSRALLKPFGRVINQATAEPLPLAVVRIFEEEKNWLLATKVSDELGRFNFLLTPGRYYLTCSKAGFLPYRSEVIVLTKAGLATIDIKLQSI
jgi:hypothetical protein